MFERVDNIAAHIVLIIIINIYIAPFLEIISSRFSSNYEDSTSELLENLEEMFPNSKWVMSR